MFDDNGCLAELRKASEMQVESLDDLTGDKAKDIKAQAQIIPTASLDPDPLPLQTALG